MQFALHNLLKLGYGSLGQEIFTKRWVNRMLPRFFSDNFSRAFMQLTDQLPDVGRFTGSTVMEHYRETLCEGHLYIKDDNSGSKPRCYLYWITWIAQQTTNGQILLIDTSDSHNNIISRKAIGHRQIVKENI